MFVYLPHRPASRAPRQEPKTRRRYSAEAWACLRGAIVREHERIAAVNPTSPRIRPSLPSLQQAGNQ
jgi:hypothetical protein